MTIDTIWKAVLGVFGVSTDEPIGFYVDIFFAVLSGIALLTVTVLCLAGHISWVFFAAIGVLVATVSLASNKREVVAAALAFVATRFVFAFAFSFRPSALLGAAIFGVAAVLVLRFKRGR